MSRTRRAAVAASFSYVQYGLAIVSGLVLVPMVVHGLGARTYGLWLASGDLLGYAAIVDLGVIGVLPWMLAEADGRKDRDAMRALVANGIVVGAVVGVGYAMFAAALCFVLPSALSITSADRATMAAPLAILVVSTMVTYPLRVFSAIIAGLQDVTFNGVLTIVQAIIGIVITVVMLLEGYGIYALAVASAATSLLTVAGAFGRIAFIAPDLLRGWPRPSVPMVRSLLTNGLGVWFGGFGWQLLAASNTLVITAVGQPEWVAVYACTAKLTAMATQLVWIVPDAGMIGLAQVHGEGRGPDRLRPLVLSMIRLHLLLAGGAACGLLAFNAAFVTRWVGPDLFGGLTLNALLAAGVIGASLVHGLLTAAAVVGNRIRVGAVTLVNGVLQVVCAWICAKAWGLPGIAFASLISGLATAVPFGIKLLHPATGMRFRHAWQLVGPWLSRGIPMMLVSAACGLLYRDVGLVGGFALGACCGIAYLWQMRPLFAGLPFDPRWTRWLVSMRLMPPASASMEQV